MNKTDFNREIVGKNIKEKRVQEHLTQAQLAEMIDISVVHLSHIENGTVNMSLKTLNALCNIFFCTPNDILLSASYHNESFDKPFLEYGLNPEDHKLIEQFTKVLRQQRREEQFENSHTQDRKPQ